MARKPDVPCAACGKLLWGGVTSLPAGQRKCRTCRGKPEHQAARSERRRQQKREWAKTHYGGVPERACGCGVVVPKHRRMCDSCRAQRAQAHWQRKNAVRRGASPLGPAITVAQLGTRDRWRCHLCRRKVDPKLPYQHRMAGTRDHLVPVADGGDDSPANLRLAHRSCNSARGTRGTVQLALLG